jgi:hypothetical protein
MADLRKFQKIFKTFHFLSAVPRAICKLSAAFPGRKRDLFPQVPNPIFGTIRTDAVVVLPGQEGPICSAERDTEATS